MDLRTSNERENLKFWHSVPWQFESLFDTTKPRVAETIRKAGHVAATRS
jgi:hypothetical protein